MIKGEALAVEAIPTASADARRIILTREAAFLKEAPLPVVRRWKLCVSSVAVTLIIDSLPSLPGPCDEPPSWLVQRHSTGRWAIQLA
jgi:hypothetical protein